jgi:hypothetical protein
MAIRVTQAGVEAWVQNPSHVRVTQIGVEVWENTNNNSNLRVTQIGLEVWRTTPAPAFGITYQVTNSINLTST